MVADYLPIPLILYYPFLAFVLLAIALATIPRHGIKRLFLESLSWGFLLSFIFVASMTGLGFFRYRYAGPFTALGSPIWLNLAWSPTIMAYLYFKPEMKQTIRFLLYLLSFGLLSAFLDTVLNKLGLLLYYRWSPVARFFVSLAWFYAAASVHERYMVRDHE
ncbi:MAG: hypothetical protein ACM3ZC_11930 [Bacteroidota bacterium]